MVKRKNSDTVPEFPVEIAVTDDDKPLEVREDQPRKKRTRKERLYRLRGFNRFTQSWEPVKETDTIGKLRKYLRDNGQVFSNIYESVVGERVYLLTADEIDPPDAKLHG